MATRSPSLTDTHAHDAELLTVREVSKIFRLDASTVRRWIKIGKIPAVELPHAGKRTVYRVKRATMEKLLIEKGEKL